MEKNDFTVIIIRAALINATPHGVVIKSQMCEQIFSHLHTNRTMRIINILETRPVLTLLSAAFCSPTGRKMSGFVIW